VQVPAPAVLSRLSEASKINEANQETDLRSFLMLPEPVVANPEPVEQAFVALTAPNTPSSSEIVVEVEPATSNAELLVETDAVVIEEPKTEIVEASAESETAAVVEPGTVEVVETVEAVNAQTGSESSVSTAQTPAQVSPDPRRATTPMPVEPRAVVPAPANVQATVSWVPVTSFRMHIPRIAALPMRPAMTFGPAPAGHAAKSEAPIVEAAAKEAGVPQQKTPEAQKPEQPASQASADRRSRDSRNASRNLKIRNRGSNPPPTAPEKPAAAPKPEPIRAAEAPVAPVVKEAAAAKEAPKPAPAKVVEPSEPKSESKSIEKPAVETSSRSFGDTPSLNIQPVGFIEGLPGVVKIAAIAAVLAILAFVAYLSLSSRSAKSGKEPVVETAGPSMLIGEGGWSTDWTGEASGAKRSRQISIYRPSLNLADYRVELQGQIEAKSMGVVYRANNPQNYYVVKLEILKPGLNPQVAVVRWSVINGEDGPKAQIPLPMPVRIDTLYKLRLDVRGNTFTTYVLDQKVDQWSDDRIHSGGVGLINERGDRSTIKAVMVTPLVTKTK